MFPTPKRKLKKKKKRCVTDYVRFLSGIQISVESVALTLALLQGETYSKKDIFGKNVNPPDFLLLL